MPSPSSDALGREIKKYSSSDFEDYDSSHQNNQPKFKSNFLQQYQKQGQQQGQGRGGAPTGSRVEKQLQYDRDEKFMTENDADDQFFSGLRGGESRKSSGPGWNSDVTSSGFEAAPQKTRPPGTQRRDVLGEYAKLPKETADPQRIKPGGSRKQADW